MKKITLMIACSAWLAGCAHYQAYEGAPEGAPPAQRLALYQQFSLHQDERGALYAQGRALNASNIGSGSPENYAKQAAPDIDYGRNPKVKFLPRDGAWLAAAAGLTYWWTQDWTVYGAGDAAVTMAVVGWLVDFSGRQEQMAVEDAQAFNEALAADLSLTAQAPLDVNPIYKANDADLGWRFALASRLERISSLDMQAYFSSSNVALPFRFQDIWEGGYALGVGYGWKEGWNLMLESSPLVRDRKVGVQWSDGSTWNQRQYAYDIILRLGKAVPWMITEKRQATLSPVLNFGMAVLDGESVALDGPSGQSGRYAYQAYTPLVGGGLRLALPVSRRTALTLELGYDQIIFSSVPVTDSNGIFAGRSSPDKNFRGEPTVWDLSGPVVRFGTEFY